MNRFDVWWRMLRPHTLTATFVPIAVGTALAYVELRRLDLSLFFAMFMASLLIQIAANIFNEYYDYVRGLDTSESIGISGTIVRDGIEPKLVLNIGFAMFGAAALIGVYICMKTSWMLAIVGALCMLIAYLYTAGPYPVAYTPFGEIASGTLMGTIIIGITFYIQTGFVSMDVILVSIPIAILIGAILTSNNIRDLVGDKENGRRTLAIILGHNRSVAFLSAMFATCYVWTIGLMLFTGYSWTLLLVFASVPQAFKAINGFKGKANQPPVTMLPAMKATAQTNTAFGFTYALGILLSAWLG